MLAKLKTNLDQAKTYQYIGSVENGMVGVVKQKPHAFVAKEDKTPCQFAKRLFQLTSINVQWNIL